MELSYKELNEIIIRKTDPMKVLLFGINIILLQFLQKRSFFFAKKGSFVSPNLTGFFKNTFPRVLYIQLDFTCKNLRLHLCHTYQVFRNAEMTFPSSNSERSLTSSIHMYFHCYFYAGYLL